MAQDDTFIWGSYTIGGSSGNFAIKQYHFKPSYRTAVFSVEFVISAATTSSLATLCEAAEAALSLPRQRLQIKFGSTTFKDLNPAAGTGFNGEPTLTKGDEGNSGLARTYTFEVVVELPSVLTAQGGRQDENWTAHYDLDGRRVVTLTGAYTAMANGAGVRASYDQYAQNIVAHADVVLALVDSGATWALAEENATPNDANSLTRYTRVYWECPYGRRNSAFSVVYLPSGNRRITINGTYVAATVSASPMSALANYQASTPAGEDAHSLYVLETTLGIASGHYELIDQEVRPNEKNELLTFVRVYRELLHQQAAGTTDDSDISDDQIQVYLLREPVKDSPPPHIVGATFAKPMVSLGVDYSCWIKNTNTNLGETWSSKVRQHVIGLLQQQLGVLPSCVETEEVHCDPVLNRITARLTLKALDADVITLQISEAISEDLGRILSPVLSGVPYSYVIQQGFAERRRTRSVSASFRTDGYFKIEGVYDDGADPDDLEKGGDWVLVARSTPKSLEWIYGAAGVGQSQIKLTTVAFVEDFVWVAKRIVGGELS